MGRLIFRAEQSRTGGYKPPCATTEHTSLGRAPGLRKGTSMSYYVTYRAVTYREFLDLDEPTRNSVVALNEDENARDLEAIRENCTLLGVDADLYDAAGFRKGWVKANGYYRLT